MIIESLIIFFGLFLVALGLEHVADALRNRENQAIMDSKIVEESINR